MVKQVIYGKQFLNLEFFNLIWFINIVFNGFRILCTSWNGLLLSKIIQEFLVYSSNCLVYLFTIIFIYFIHWNLSCLISYGQALTSWIFSKWLPSCPKNIDVIIPLFLMVWDYTYFPMYVKWFLDFQFSPIFFLYIYTQILCVATYNVRHILQLLYD